MSFFKPSDFKDKWEQQASPEAAAQIANKILASTLIEPLLLIERALTEVDPKGHLANNARTEIDKLLKKVGVKKMTEGKL